jgi:hypothetical protein
MSDQHEHFNVSQEAGVLHDDVPYLLEAEGVRKEFPVSSRSTESSCRFAREPSTP